MILEKELTIYEIIREMRTLKRTILCLSEKKYLNRVLRFMKAISIKDVCVQSSKGGNDSMINNMIKNEQFDESIESNLISYNDYKKEAIKKIREMISEKSEDEMIVFYRDELQWEWKDVAKAISLSVRQVQRKYNAQKYSKS